MSSARIRANSLLFGVDLFREAANNLQRGISVTHFVWDDGKGAAIEFDVVITKIGDKRLPRVTEKAAQRAAKQG